MSKTKIKDADYLYLTAMLKAREPKMLNAQRLERVLEAPGFDGAAKLLCDCGFEDMSGMNASQVEETLKKRQEAIFSELTALVPEPELLQLFRLKYDYHNAKVMIKSQAAGIEAEYLLSNAGNIPAARLAEGCSSEEHDTLPELLARAVTESAAVLSRTENPQLADFIMDRAYFENMLLLAQAISNPFMQQYVSVLADSANLRAAVRTARMGRDMEFLRRALVPGGNRKPEEIAQAVLYGDGAAELFAGTVLWQAAVTAAQQGSLTEFELECDNAVTAFFAQAGTVSFGAPAVAAYLAAVEGEMMAVRILLTGKLAGVQPEKLRERLRDTYA